MELTTDRFNDDSFVFSDWLDKINKLSPGYDFQFEDAEVARYFFENCIDLTVDKTYCIQNRLPYVDHKGMLRNINKFRSAAINFQKNKGHYQTAPYRSEQMMNFWDREKDRCKNGLKLGQITITGKFYFFLNYYSMIIADKDGEESRSLPYWWFVHYNFSHLLEYCQKKKLNLPLIKPRSVGLSEFAASVGVYDFFMVMLDNAGEPRFKSNRYFSNDKKYLQGEDGIFPKMTKAIQWLNTKGENKFKKDTTHTRNNSDMLWVAGYREKDNTQIQTGGSVKCTILTSPDDARGGRISTGWWEECLYEKEPVLMFNGDFKEVKDLEIGDCLMGLDGSPRKVEKLNKGVGQLFKVSQSYGEDYYVTGNHRLYFLEFGKDGSYKEEFISVEDYLKLPLKRRKSLRGGHSPGVYYKEKNTSLDPYYLGAWLGAGSSNDQVVVVNDKNIEIIEELERYCNLLGDKTVDMHIYTPSTKKYSEGNQCRYYRIRQKSKVYRKGSNPVLQGLRSYNLLNNKHIPKVFKHNSYDVRLNILAGIIDTDGYLSYKGETYLYEIELASKQLIYDIVEISRSCGITARQYSRERNGKQYHRVVLTGRIDKIPVRVERKKVPKDYKGDWKKLLSKVTIEPFRVDNYVGIELDGDRLHYLKDFTITHNSGANPKLGESLQVGRSLTQRGDVKTGIHVIWGTSNANKDGIEAFEAILTNPRAYDCVAFKNVWKGIDKVSEKNRLSEVPLYCFEYMLGDDSDDPGIGWFIPYYDVKGLDPDGNPNREEMFDKIMAERYDAMNTSGTDKNVLLWIADHPVTMEEALFKGGNSMFATDELAARYQDMTVHRSIPSPEIGDLIWEKGAGGVITGVKFKANPAGKFHIVEHPVRTLEEDKRIFKNLYIGGIDSIDQGTDESQSLKGSQFCCLIKKRMIGITHGNAYVAYYMDRPRLPEEAYENAAKLLWYFDCQANLEFTRTRILTEFRNKNWLHLLYPRPRVANTDVVKQDYSLSNKYGTPAAERYIVHGLELIKNHVVHHCDKIFLPELAKQLLEYDYENKGEYDMIAAMQMCEIADEDMKPLSTTNEKKREPFKIGYYYDEHGHKRKGVIKGKGQEIKYPKKEPTSVAYFKNGKAVREGEDKMATYERVPSTNVIYRK